MLLRMGALKDLWRSERGLVTVALIVCATVLCCLMMLTSQQWVDFIKWVFVVYVTGKTVTGTVGLVKAGTAQPVIPDDESRIPDNAGIFGAQMGAEFPPEAVDSDAASVYQVPPWQDQQASVRSGQPSNVLKIDPSHPPLPTTERKE